MSDCRWGVRPYPVKEYDHTEPIRGSLNYADGSVSKFTYARFVNGNERVVRDVTVDGTRYLPAPEKDYDSEVVD